MNNYTALIQVTVQVAEDRWIYRPYTLRCTDETTIADIKKWAVEKSLSTELHVTIINLDTLTTA